MGKTLLCALALVGCTATAHAGDLIDNVTSMKDPIPDNLAFHGVTVYGTVDVGFAYQTHGVPLSGNFPVGLEYNITGSKNANKSMATLAENGLEQSKIGIKIEENLGYGWAAIGKIEAGFNPLSGELSDGPGSQVRNNGRSAADQTANGDSSRAGQAFSGPVYAGLSNATYGTLTVGRQQSLMLDTIAVYDPQSLSYAFSPIGYSGLSAGAGDTQDARWDNSVKYIYQYGPAHAAAMYSQGGSETGMFGGGYGFDVGASWRGFSVDAVYTKERGAVSTSPIAFGQCDPAINKALTGSLSCANTLNGTISDNDMWSVQGKYTFNIGGGYKDEGPAAKLTFYGGYENITQSDPSGTISNGQLTEGGYPIIANNTAFFTDKVTQVAWTGAKYELPSGWSFTGAYYHYDQNSFLAGPTGTSCTGSGKNSSSNCSGTLNDASFVVDYQVNKHFDVYAGLNYSDVSGGLSSGFLNDNMTTVMTGARLKF